MIRRTLLQGILGTFGLTALTVDRPSAKPPEFLPDRRNVVLRGQKFSVASSTVIDKGDMLWLCQDGAVTNRPPVLGLTGGESRMKLPLLLIMFSMLSNLIFGADIYLYSPDGKPMDGYEIKDLSVEWRHAKFLSPQGLGNGYPVAHFKDPSRATGWTYDFSKTPREVRAAYRKAQNITEAGRSTATVSSATWCGPCKRMKKEGLIDDLKKIMDVEVYDIDAVNPFDDKTVPTIRLFDADNRQVQIFTGYTTITTIREALNK